MWHKVVLPGDTHLDAAIEQMRVMNSLSTRLLRANFETAGSVKALREAGLNVRLEQRPLEIYRDRDSRAGKITWWLNDAALDACRQAGETVQPAESMQELPPAHRRTVIMHNTLFVIAAD